MTSALEEELTSITREFVARIVSAIRGASFADVASLPSAPSFAPRVDHDERRPPVRRPAPQTSSPAASAASGGTRTRASAESLAEISTRVMQVLARSGEPMGVRALAGELRVSPERLLVPLKQLRNAGKVTKHGDKRSTRYAVA